MKFQIRGERMEVTDSIKDYVIEKLSKMEKYFDNPENVVCKVVFSIRGREQKVEVTISGKYDLRAEVSHSDLYAAIDLVIDKLETQMRKHKSKLMSKERVQIVYNEEDILDDEEIEEIVKRKKVFLKPMHEEDAILEMELSGHNFYIYKDIRTENVNVIYKRYDDSYGIIETN